MKGLRMIVVLMLFTTITMNTSGCATVSDASGADLMSGVTRENVDAKPVDDGFIESMASFSIELFKKGITDKENSLVSPTSVMLSLAMTANGADNNTKTQMETVLGGDIPLDTLNEYLLGYVNSLPSEERAKLHIANSVWFRDNKDELQVKKDFLQQCANYYQASMYKAAFNNQTVEDINNWVKLNTDNMIDAIIEEIQDLDMLFLINAITFDAKWETPYAEWDLSKGDFTDINGVAKNVDFMGMSEYGYLNDGKATGFIKPYAIGYSFVTLLPNQNIPIESYIDSLTGNGFIQTIQQARNEQAKVETYLPKFEYDYEIKLNDTLSTLGMPDAFTDSADFSKMARSSMGPLYLSEVLHKTYISVGEQGTKAGAVTESRAEAQSGPVGVVRLDRPFVYAIIDDATNLPIFIGTLMTI